MIVKSKNKFLLCVITVLRYTLYYFGHVYVVIEYFDLFLIAVDCVMFGTVSQRLLVVW